MAAKSPGNLQENSGQTKCRAQVCDPIRGYTLRQVPALGCAARTGKRGGRPRGRAAGTKRTERRTTMTKIVFALALTIAALATVPASAGTGCQEDLGYGRTSSFGCGG